MGLSGILLKRKDDIEPLKTIEDIKTAAQKADLLIIVNNIIYREDGIFDYTTANVANTFEEIDGEEQLLMYIYGKSENIFDTQFDFIIKNGLLNQVINIENFHDCERILLDFVYEYMKLNQNDIFWDEMKWFYSFKDIEIIHSQEFDKEWCYKKPKWK